MTEVVKRADVKEVGAHDTPRRLDWINVKLIWKAPADLDLHAFFKLTNGDVSHIHSGERDHEFVSLDVGNDVGSATDNQTCNVESMHCRRLDETERILFAIMRPGEDGCFSDYHGRLEFTTSNLDQPAICISILPSENKAWCVIAMFDNSDRQAPRVLPINHAMSSEPDINDPMWLSIGKN